MRIGHVGVPGRRVDLAARSGHDLPIPEIFDQRRVVGVQQTRPADEGERKHMYVIRIAAPLPAEAGGVIVNYLVRH